MGRNLMAQITKYLSSYKRKRIGYWVLCSMGAVVVFCTTYALIMPAVTMSNEPICGLEAHVHDESCWSLEYVAPEAELICEEWRDADVVFHTHDALCYDSEGVLICPLEERERHVHSEGCFIEQMELICGETDGEPEELVVIVEPEPEPQPYIQPHIHTEECYSLQPGELVCGLEEDPGHQHTEECYTMEFAGAFIKVCPYEEGEVIDVILGEQGEILEEIQHYHDDNTCYQPEMTHVLSCGQEEREGHQHTDECYTWEQVLICQEPEIPEVLPEETPVVPVVPDVVPEAHVHTEECYQITRTQVCGEEEYELHTHGPECYETIQVDDGMGGMEPREVLTCQLPVVVEHQHTEACLQQAEGEDREVMVRTCGLTAHVHDDSCYLDLGPDPDPNRCGLAEHTHTEECYFESGELRCTVPEHIHTDECLNPDNFSDPEYPLFPDEEQTGYVCGLEAHEHSDECWLDGELVCGLEEHVHGEECLPWEDGQPDEDGEWLVDENGNWILDENGERIPLNPEDPGEDDTGLDNPDLDDPVLNDPSLEPVEINDTYEYETDAFVMTFSIEGIALPVVEDDELMTPSAPSAGWDGGDIPPLFQDAVSGIVPLPDIGLDQDTVHDAVDDLPETNIPEEIDTAAGAPADDVFPDEPDDTPIPLPEALPDELEDQEPEESARRGRVLSMSLESPGVPLSALPEGFDEDISGEEASAGMGGGETSGIDMSGGEDAGLDESQNEGPDAGTPVYDLPDPPAYVETQTPSYQEPAEEPQIEFHVEEVTEGEAYEALLAQVMETVDEDALIAPPQIMEITATYNGRKLDLSGCQITVEVQPTRALAETVSGEAVSTMDLMDGESEEEAGEPGMSLMVLPVGGEPVFKLFSGEEMQSEEALPPVAVTFTAPSDGPVLYAATPTFVVNPQFKVEFFAYLNVPESSEGTSNTSLPFIDTSKTTGMGRLPQNGDASVKEISLGLNTDGTVVFHIKETEIYKSETKEFNPKLKDELNINYLNSLRDNVHYAVKELWVLKDLAAVAGESAQDREKRVDEWKEDKNNWDIYDVTGNTSALAFTNDPALKGEKDDQGRSYICIDENTVLRLVYNPVDTTESFKSTFYDYDISSGPKTASAMKTTRFGINAYLPETGNGRFAFGNANMGTIFANDTIGNGSTLNKFNRTTYQGLTLGLVSGVNETGNDVIFSSGVTGPSIGLFGANEGTGKVMYPNWNLGFTRAGDTFTLSTVSMTDNKTVASGLEKFGHPGKYDGKHPNGNGGYFKMIWTNNFWPLDEKWSDQSKILDPMFGGNTMPQHSTGKVPPSDDDIDHNSYFGMTYSISFDLVEEYIGPLEYYFYGDDDLWVFLDGRLVCDIGGVHSSVGEYVDLWDYIEGGREGHAKGQHKLSVFYTERGASGSSCWMQFTLPQISQMYNTPYDPTQASLTIRKTAVGTTEEVENTEFPFILRLDGIYNQYTVKRCAEDGSVIETGSISTNEYSFNLKSGEYLEVISLPIGTTYWVEEKYSDVNCDTNVTTNGTTEHTVLAHGTITGEVVDGKDQVESVTVHYVNSFLYSLPETGGPSALMYTLGGTLLLTTAAGSLVYKKKSKRRGAADKT